MKKDEIPGLQYNPKTGNNNHVQSCFMPSEVIGLTMAPDGTPYANLKGFRQARLRLIDYMNLKERRDAKQA